jgi:hypothetical protein
MSLEAPFDFDFEIELKPPLFNSMWDRCQTGLRDLHVVLRRVEARADSADHLA